jgi:NTP-dependent ternary system trypsin peptidase co-occuring protein
MPTCAFSLWLGRWWGVMVTNMNDGWIGLADTMRALRRELDVARAEGADDRVRFELGPVEVEFALTVARDAEADAGIRFGVVSIGAKGSVSSESAHRLKLVLTPTDSTTGRAPEIAGEIDGIPDR